MFACKPMTSPGSRKFNIWRRSSGKPLAMALARPRHAGEGDAIGDYQAELRPVTADPFPRGERMNHLRQLDPLRRRQFAVRLDDTIGAVLHADDIA